MPPPSAAQQAAAEQPQRQQSLHPPGVALSMPRTNGTPISMQAQLKKMQPPMNVPQMRISNNGGMRPPSTPTISVPLQSVASVTGLSVQHMQSLKSAFTASQDMSVPVTNGAHNSRAATYTGHVVPNGANYNLPLNLNMNNMAMNIKLPNARQMQWAAAQTPEAAERRPAHLASSPPQGRALPAASAHGINIAHSLLPHLHSPNAMRGQQLSPPRPPQTPVPVSPSLQQQAAVGPSAANS
ncbi:hypothetical protein DENSPDRAFT_883731 [Dentipellis sp. KUC8613]|nr:hypothetical protein DENSPDRAFT_883731 [Dentipellis sp. KUC8613]